jgi:hypothetical protein
MRRSTHLGVIVVSKMSRGTVMLARLAGIPVASGCRVVIAIR